MWAREGPTGFDVWVWVWVWFFFSLSRVTSPPVSSLRFLVCIYPVFSSDYLFYFFNTPALYALSGFISLLRIQHTYYHRLQLYYLIVVSLTTICALEFIFQVDPTCVSAAGVWDEAMRMNGQCCCVQWTIDLDPISHWHDSSRTSTKLWLRWCCFAICFACRFWAEFSGR